MLKPIKTVTKKFFKDETINKVLLSLFIQKNFGKGVISKFKLKMNSKNSSLKINIEESNILEYLKSVNSLDEVSADELTYTIDSLEELRVIQIDEYCESCPIEVIFI
jgi:hypothetical protein